MLLHTDFWVAAGAAAPVIALANQVTLGGLQGWTWAPAQRDASEGVLVPFPLREIWSWALVVGSLNLLAQMFALTVALFSLLFGRDLFSWSAPAVATVEPVGLALILLSALLGRFDPELKRIRNHVSEVEARQEPAGPATSGQT